MLAVDPAGTEEGIRNIENWSSNPFTVSGSHYESWLLQSSTNAFQVFLRVDIINMIHLAHIVRPAVSTCWCIVEKKVAFMRRLLGDTCVASACQSIGTCVREFADVKISMFDFRCKLQGGLRRFMAWCPDYRADRYGLWLCVLLKRFLLISRWTYGRRNGAA